MKSLWTRLRTYFSNMRDVLAMNQRNLEYIYVLNQRRDYPLADDKLTTKQLLLRVGAPVPETYAVFEYFYDLRHLEEQLRKISDFVIKPARGSGGGGILIITGRDGKDWLGPGSRRYQLDEIKRHIGDIIFGIYSFGISDRAIIEQRIEQHPYVERLGQGGLADIRIIACNDRLTMAMMRLPTEESGGRANLHQGALGVGIEMETGTTSHASYHGVELSAHPDNGEPLLGRQIPMWDQVLDAAEMAAKAVPLKYLGIDVALSQAGPVILELNVRPGIEIQNVNNKGLRRRLTDLEAAS